MYKRQILRADAVVVPVNPMNLTLELEHFVNDSGAKVALVTQELFAQWEPLLEGGLERMIVASYSASGSIRRQSCPAGLCRRTAPVV